MKSRGGGGGKGKSEGKVEIARNETGFIEWRLHRIN